jgi:Fe-S-cluster containining protein
LELIYLRTTREIEARAPRCDASGRCCNFEAWGHRLYVTGLEAAYLLTRLAERGVPELTFEAVAAARNAGGCPFQKALLCSVHPVRPLGCRTYYCDPTSTDWQHDLTERQLGAIRALHDAHSLPYRYGEWRGMLEQVLNGRIAGA